MCFYFNQIVLLFRSDIEQEGDSPIFDQRVLLFRSDIEQENDS